MFEGFFAKFSELSAQQLALEDPNEFITLHERHKKIAGEVVNIFLSECCTRNTYYTFAHEEVSLIGEIIDDRGGVREDLNNKIIDNVVRLDFPRYFEKLFASKNLMYNYPDFQETFEKIILIFTQNMHSKALEESRQRQKGINYSREDDLVYLKQQRAMETLFLGVKLFTNTKECGLRVDPTLLRGEYDRRTDVLMEVFNTMYREGYADRPSPVGVAWRSAVMTNWLFPASVKMFLRNIPLKSNTFIKMKDSIRLQLDAKFHSREAGSCVFFTENHYLTNINSFGIRNTDQIELVKIPPNKHLINKD